MTVQRTSRDVRVAPARVPAGPDDDSRTLGSPRRGRHWGWVFVVLAAADAASLAGGAYALWTLQAWSPSDPGGVAWALRAIVAAFLLALIAFWPGIVSLRRARTRAQSRSSWAGCFVAAGALGLSTVDFGFAMFIGLVLTFVNSI